jgi:L-alanine-DL-glutamate epimerase-like enolase superfamily enzyme
VAGSTPGVPYVEMPPGQLTVSLTARPIRCADGTVAMPEGPGLGADPDPDVLQRYAYTPDSARPFYLA